MLLLKHVHTAGRTTRTAHAGDHSYYYEIVSDELHRCMRHPLMPAIHTSKRHHTLENAYW